MQGSEHSLLSVAAAVALMLASLPVAAQGDAERELEAVRAEIHGLEQRLDKQVVARDDGLADLKRLEVEIAATRAALGSIEARSREQERRGAELSKSEADAAEQLGNEREALAEQVRMSYMTGQQELFKLLFSQEDPADLGRMLVFYDYLNRARGERIGRVGAELERLAGLEAAGREVQRELERLSGARASELERLSGARSERRRVVDGLETAISRSGSEIERLRREEQRLDDLVTELSELLAGFPVDTEAAFGELKGKLRWPIDGRIAQDYGELREGGPLRWNGVLLEAEAGSTVRAVYHGRVAFADWLPGLGLLLIIDHGDGYMSLYGHNEALLSEPGDWVSPGEAIAQVGDTGGQSAPSLYFEIRRNGEPLNPHAWVP